MPAGSRAAEATKPLFEVGVAGGAGYVADYPAADQNHVRGLALPYVIYRGDLVSADRSGVRGRFYRSERVQLELSLDGDLGASSDDNRARRGMPDLDYLGQIGPGLKVVLARPSPDLRLDLDVPVRSVFSTDFSRIDYRGFVLAPTVAATRYDLIEEGSRWRTSVGPVFATKRLMEYFYTVKPPFALPDRPAFEASGGYLGTRLQSTFTVPVTDRVSVFGAVRAELFPGATNDDSPLFKRDVNVSFGGGVSIALYRSEARVERKNDRDGE